MAAPNFSVERRAAVACRFRRLVPAAIAHLPVSACTGAIA